MNPKLIIASIAGVSALGGGATGAYYYFKSDTSNSEKQTNDTTTTDSLKSTAPKSEVQGNSVQSEPNPAKPTTDHDAPKTNVKVQPDPSPQSLAGKEAGTSLPSDEGVSETGVATSGVVPASPVVPKV